jgi:hypothetical protein
MAWVNACCEYSAVRCEYSAVHSESTRSFAAAQNADLQQHRHDAVVHARGLQQQRRRRRILRHQRLQQSAPHQLAIIRCGSRPRVAASQSHRSKRHAVYHLADVEGSSPVPVRMREGCAHSRCRWSTITTHKQPHLPTVSTSSRSASRTDSAVSSACQSEDQRGGRVHVAGWWVEAAPKASMVSYSSRYLHVQPKLSTHQQARMHVLVR